MRATTAPGTTPCLCRVLPSTMGAFADPSPVTSIAPHAGVAQEHPP